MAEYILVAGLDLHELGTKTTQTHQVDRWFPESGVKYQISHTDNIWTIGKHRFVLEGTRSDRFSWEDSAIIRRDGLRIYYNYGQDSILLGVPVHSYESAEDEDPFQNGVQQANLRTKFTRVRSLLRKLNPRCPLPKLYFFRED